MIAVVLGDTSSSHSVVLNAFREEEPSCLLVSRNDELGAIERRAGEIKNIIAATPGAVAFAEQLQHQLGHQGNDIRSRKMRTQRSEQRKLLAAPGSNQSRLVTTAGDLESYINEAATPLLLRPDVIGDHDPIFVCRDREDAKRVFASLDPTGDHAPACLVEPFLPGTCFGVDTVSHDGEHFIAGIYEHRLDEVDGRLFLRHRISRSIGTEPLGLVEAAMTALDQIGIINGAGYLEIVSSDEGFAFADVLAAPLVPAVPADTAFTAFGYSHQHLLAEQVLRPHEFQRRLEWPPRRLRCCIAIAPLRTWTDAAIEASDGLRVLRRLTGFHSVSRLVPWGSSLDAGGVAGIASFVHSDQASVENSLKVLHEMEDSGFFFGHGQPFFG